MSDELRALARSSTAELDSWLSQEIQDELGTRAFILRAIAWCRRGALARAREDVDAALAKLPAHEIVELTGAMILFVTHDYDRAAGLLESVARRHRYMAAQTLRVLVSQLARLGWAVEQRVAEQQLAALGVRDLRAHIHRLQERRGGGRALESDAITGLLGELCEGGEPTRERMLELDALATGLLSDAARELGVTLWGDGGLIDDPPTFARVCAHARTMLVVEPDTPLGYRTRTGRGTLALRQIPDASVARVAHANDDADLELTAKLLVRSIEKQRGVAHRATAARSLDAGQIDAFLADGYVHLRGAFSKQLAANVVAAAHRRVREAGQVVGYDADDPSTWPQGRIDIEGERRFTISEFSPYAERAVFQLLGDAARVRTRSWTSNLIAQYPVRALESWIPAPDHQSWHLDSPSKHTRIDDLRTGLLVFILFSDLLPDSGNTWLALDSPAKVARRLAAAPEGVDFCSDQAGNAITRHCERFFELTGEAGDLFLVHPLMLHSASLNPSPRIRFLGNPMVYLQEPLDPRRADPSPVEQLIARSLATV